MNPDRIVLLIGGVAIVLLAGFAWRLASRKPPDKPQNPGRSLFR